MFKPSGYPFVSKLRNDIFFAIIVLLIGSIIGFIVLPFVISNFEQRAYIADRTALQNAVEEYQLNVSPIVQLPVPTLSGAVGVPAEGLIDGYQCDGSDSAEICSWLDLRKLVAAGVLPGSEVIRSADSIKNSSATNAPSGQYGWYLGNDELVYSQPGYSSELGYP